MSVTIEGNGLITAGGTSTTQGRVRLAEDTDNGTNYIELTAPASVTSNQTITLPDNTGTIITTASTVSYPKGGPAFSVYRNTDQTGISSAVFTKVQFNNEDFDTASCFDSSTNYRFTPNVTGYYQFNWAVWITGTGQSATVALIYKNGSAYKYGNFASGQIGGVVSVGSELIYMNGSTDYVEIFGATTTTSGTVTFQTASVTTLCRFSGFLASAA